MTTARKPRAKGAPATKPATVLVLRTCAADLTSHGGFRWPDSGAVECPDWDPTPRCGGGLHGLLWGEGNGGLVSWDDDAKWLVVEVEADTVVPIDGGEKVKFPRGTVVFCGARLEATAFLASVRPGAIVGGTATAGDRGAIAIKWWDRSATRYRLIVGYVGEDGIEKDRAYRVSDEGKLVPVDQAAVDEVAAQ